MYIRVRNLVPWIGLLFLSVFGASLLVSCGGPTSTTNTTIVAEECMPTSATPVAAPGVSKSNYTVTCTASRKTYTLALTKPQVETKDLRKDMWGIAFTDQNGANCPNKQLIINESGEKVVSYSCSGALLVFEQYVDATGTKFTITQIPDVGNTQIQLTDGRTLKFANGVYTP